MAKSRITSSTIFWSASHLHGSGVGLRFAAGRFDFGDRFHGRFFIAPVVHRDGGAIGGQGEGDRLADSAASAGNKRDASCE